MVANFAKKKLNLCVGLIPDNFFKVCCFLRGWS
jgi:hypothetical protein